MTLLRGAELETGLAGWREAVLGDPKARWDAHRDLSYWQQAALDYEAHRQPIPNTITTLQAQLRPEWSLMDVGAGTGRFTRPLAPFAQSVTALDYSADMLAVLVAAGLPSNVSVLPLDFHSPDIPVHDAVLSAWALYRSPELRADVLRLFRLARQVLLVLEDNGLPSPHAAWKRERRPQRWPRTALIAGILNEQAQVTLLDISEERREIYPDQQTLCIRYKVAGHQRDDFLAHLSPFLNMTAQGLEYRYDAINTLVIACP